MSKGAGAVAAEKRALRERALMERAALSEPVRAEASAAIAARLGALPELVRARTILGYAAFGAEVDLDSYLATRLAGGNQIYLPWVDGQNQELRVAPVPDLDRAIAPGWRGVREPCRHWRRDVDPRVLDAVVVPGVAFDRRGRRLGYGGGHFDRVLARLRPGTFVVGVAFDAQLVDAVPVADHDVPMDAVVTESCTVRANA